MRAGELKENENIFVNSWIRSLSNQEGLNMKASNKNHGPTLISK